MRKQQGLSLIELMISITIGLVLMTGVVQMFLSSRTVFSTQQAISRVQESGRLAMEFMARDVRMAGYMGCLGRNMPLTNTLNNTTDFAYNFDVGIEGATVPSVGNLPAGYPTTALPGTDVLVIRSVSGGSMALAEKNNTGSAQLSAIRDPNGNVACANNKTGYNGVCEGDILVVSDCQKARVFQVTNLQAQGQDRVNVVHSMNQGNNNFVPGNAIASWGGQSNQAGQFGADAEVTQISTIAYYIANGASGRPSLWQRVGNQVGQELLEGVESMRVTYSRGGAYETASIVGGAWADVVSVRIELLLASVEDGALAESQPYTFNGATVTPTDRRLRQVFTNTVAIRGRLR